MKNITETDSGLMAALHALRAFKLDGVPVAAVPPDFKLESLRKFYEFPADDAGTVGVHTLSSLADYVSHHASANSAIFASRDCALVCGVIDWHTAGGPPSERAGWARHRVEYKLEHTPEWKAWTGINGKAMSQDAFAEFLEENLPDIIEPAGASVLETASTLSGKRNVQFLSSRNLGNGDVGLMWKEETDAGGGVNGDTKVPAELKLKLPVYRGAEKATTFDVKAFLRYRIREGKLTFEVKLWRPEKAIELAFDEVAAALASELNARELQVPVYLGAVRQWPADILA
jgi:uncharacterized protein YfdQ (DUF2303 family)